MKLNFSNALCIGLSIVVLVAASALAQSDPAVPGPVPPAILSAKTVFVSNGGSDSGLFPTPFTGDENRGYNEFYSKLKSAGQFQLASDPSEADLVLELRLTAPYGPSNANKQNGTADPRPMFRLVVYDRKTHYVLWTVTENIELAMLQKTHDRNFDEALDRVLFRLLQAAGRPPATANAVH